MFSFSIAIIEIIIVIKNIPRKYTYFLKFISIDNIISADQKPKLANTIFKELNLLYNNFPTKTPDIKKIIDSKIVKCNIFINIIN